MRFLPARAHLWQTVRLLLACSLAEGGGLALGLSESYWALITAVVVTRPMQSDARGQSRDRTLASLIGAAFGLGVLELERFGGPKGLLFCLAFAPIALIVSVWPNLRLSAVTLIVVVLVPSTNSPLVRPIDRVVEIVIGSLAGWIVSAMLDSDRLRRRLPTARAPEENEGT